MKDALNGYRPQSDASIVDDNQRSSRQFDQAVCKLASWANYRLRGRGRALLCPTGGGNIMKILMQFSYIYNSMERVLCSDFKLLSF